MFCRDGGVVWCSWCFGTIRDEFLHVLRSHAKISRKMLSDRDLDHVFCAVDTDASGTIDLDEFTYVGRAVLFPSTASDKRWY